MARPTPRPQVSQWGVWNLKDMFTSVAGRPAGPEAHESAEMDELPPRAQSP